MVHLNYIEIVPVIKTHAHPVNVRKLIIIPPTNTTIITVHRNKRRKTEMCTLSLIQFYCYYFKDE